MFVSAVVQDLQSGAHRLRRWRCAQIIVRDGRLEAIRRRWMPATVSVAQVWWQARFARERADVCRLDYHQPLGMPGFLVLDYIRSGKGTRLSSFLGACRVLDEIARIRNCHAIVAHVSNASISDRLLSRLGWQQHLESWPGRHWIKRRRPDACRAAATNRETPGRRDLALPSNVATVYPRNESLIAVSETCASAWAVSDDAGSELHEPPARTTFPEPRR